MAIFQLYPPIPPKLVMKNQAALPEGPKGPWSDPMISWDGFQ